MRLAVGSLVLTLLAFQPLESQELEKPILQQIKAATCYVVVDLPHARRSGSGVLFLKKEDTGYILTCQHVVRNADSVKVVFHSGTPEEQSFDGRVIGTDPDHDLACVVVTGVGRLPDPLLIGRNTSVTETATLFVAGFPFGGLLAAGDKNPEVSVTKVTVSSVRRDNVDRVVAIQMSGDVNPGNSGGPVVDSKADVIGIAQSKVDGTSTAFAVPVEQIHSFFARGVSAVHVKATASATTFVRFEVRADLMDLRGRIREIRIRWYPESAYRAADPAPGPDGTWRLAVPEDQAQSVSLERHPGGAVGKFDLSRQPKDPSRQRYYYQIVSRTTIDEQWTVPRPFEVEFLGDPDVPAPAGGGLEVAKLEDVPIGDPKIDFTQRLRAAIPEMILAPDRSALYVLDVSEGRILALKPETLEITAKADIFDNATCMTISPDGSELYVGGWEIHPVEWAGRIQVFTGGTLTPAPSWTLPFPVHQMLATGRGSLLAARRDGTNGIAKIDTTSKTCSTMSPRIPSGCMIRLHPDGLRVYAAPSNNTIPCYSFSLRADPANHYDLFQAAFSLQRCPGGEFEITPDGRYMLTRSGGAFKLGALEEHAITFAAPIDAGVAIATAKGANTFFVANGAGFLKVYSLSTLEVQRSVQLGKTCSRLILDPGRNRLYAVARILPPPRFDASIDSRILFASDVLSISLGGKP